MSAVVRPAARRVGHETYAGGFRLVWTALAVNLLLALTTSPLLAVLGLLTDPVAAWPRVLAVSVVCGPALVGAFGVFAAPDEPVGRTFWSAYRSGWRRGLAVWAAAAAAVGVLGVDVAGALTGSGAAWAGPLLPLFLVGIVVVVAVAAFALVAAVELPDARFGALLRACVFLVVRRWYLALVSVAVLGLLAAAVVTHPVVGALLACSPLLYVVFGNARYALSTAVGGPDPEHV